MNKEQFTYRLKYAMKLKNITQYSLSKNSGINKGSLSSYMNGKYLPKQDKIYLIASILKVNPEWLMCNSENMDITNIQPNSSINTHNSDLNKYSYISDPVSAGIPNSIEGYSSLEQIQIPDLFLGRYAGRKDILVMRVNGDSMNKLIPDGSIIIVLTNINISSLTSEDIVVFSYDYEYSVKKMIKNKKENTLIFRPESYDDCFKDLIVNYEDPNLQIIGKVIMYNVVL